MRSESEMEMRPTRTRVKKRRSGATDPDRFKRATVRWPREDVERASDLAAMMGVTFSHVADLALRRFLATVPDTAALAEALARAEDARACGVDQGVEAVACEAGPSELSLGETSHEAHVQEAEQMLETIRKRFLERLVS